MTINNNNEMKKKKDLMKKEWIDFAKYLKDSGGVDEDWENLEITEEQYKWFGWVMANMKEQSEFPIPCGTECRKWPRAFYQIIEGGIQFVKDYLNNWAIQSHDEWVNQNIYGDVAIYDLIGYGVQPLFNKNDLYSIKS